MASVPLPDLSGLTILVVDDNEDALEMLGTFLTACGANALLAHGASDAVRHIGTQRRIDVLITDLSMPGMDGVELVRRFRRHPRHSTIPAIALTGFDKSYMDTSVFDAFLRKPVDLDGLCETITRIVKRRTRRTDRQGGE